MRRRGKEDFLQCRNGNGHGIKYNCLRLQVPDWAQTGSNGIEQDLFVQLCTGRVGGKYGAFGDGSLFFAATIKFYIIIN